MNTAVKACSSHSIWVGLEPVELIAPISARLIVNRSAMKVRHVELSAIIQELAAACKPSASVPTKS